MKKKDRKTDSEQVLTCEHNVSGNRIEKEDIGVKVWLKGGKQGKKELKVRKGKERRKRKDGKEKKEKKRDNESLLNYVKNVRGN